MEDREIIEALECCSLMQGECKECPCDSVMDCDCEEMLLREAFYLINRQKAEIEKKDTEIEILIRKKHALRDEISELTAEVERLKAEIRNTDNILNSLDRPLIEVKTEAYREFAERLKDMSEDCTDWGKPYVLCKDIDWLLERIQEGI